MDAESLDIQEILGFPLLKHPMVVNFWLYRGLPLSFQEFAAIPHPGGLRLRNVPEPQGAAP